jgi:hypothetical protein
MKLSEAIALYIELRDEKAQLRKQFTASVEGLDLKLKKLEAMFLKAFEKTGQNSAKADTGTAFIKERTTDKVVDREAYIAFLQAEGHFDMIESRVNKTALDEYIEEHEDLPPGITRSVERIINVRRA